MKKTKLLIYGVGRFAEYAAYVFDYDSNYKVAGFCMEKKFIDNEEGSYIKGRVIPLEEIDRDYSRVEYKIFIAIGNNLIREKVFNKIKERGFNLANYISSKSQTWPNLKLGENCFISDGNAIQPFTTIGNSTILFNSSIGHHSTIGDHSLVSGSILGGNVEIGKVCFIGMGSVIKQNVKIGDKNIIGMGSIIGSNTTENTVFAPKVTEARSISFDKAANIFLK